MRLNQTKIAGAALLAVAFVAGYAANKYNKPKSVLHVITMHYKDGTTDEQKKAVLDATEKMASEVPGLKNIWLKTAKVQGSYMDKQPDGSMKARPFTDVIGMEFEDDAAFKAYADHPSHKAWEKIYTDARGRSSTVDVTN